MDLTPLIRVNNVLAAKSFRDKYLKCIQYTAKCFLDFPAPAGAAAGANGVPDAVRVPLKVLSGHISAARRLYRYIPSSRDPDTNQSPLAPASAGMPSYVLEVLGIYLYHFCDIFWDSTGTPACADV